MKTEIKRLNLIRESLITEREKKIFEFEEGNLTDEERAAISDIINSLTERINNIDSKLPKKQT